jgi:DNA-binding transcriptional LysR family regulator
MSESAWPSHYKTRGWYHGVWARCFQCYARRPPPSYLRTPQAPDDLRNHACLQAATSVSPVWKLMGPGNRSHELVPKGPCVADTPDVLRDIAEASVGIALLPVFSVIDAVRNGRLVQVHTPWRSPDIGVFALMPSRHFMDARQVGGWHITMSRWRQRSSRMLDSSWPHPSEDRARTAGSAVSRKSRS